MDLNSYLERVQQDMDLIIRRRFGDLRDGLGEASAHLLLAGGKRLRPALLLLSADAIKRGRSLDLVPAALSMELVHTFTLIHDDIMDRDAERRGVPTVHTKWDEATAILAGDVLYARAFEYLGSVPAPDFQRVKAFVLLSKTCAEICEGQYMDISFEKRERVGEPEYFDMVRKKTGALFAASAAIGGILAGGNRMQVDALYEFGLAAGIAFQIQDDLIDITSRSEKMGKDRASDIRKEKKTLIAIKAREKGIDLGEFREVREDREIDRLVVRLQESGVIGEVKESSGSMLDRALRVIRILPETEERGLLEEMARLFVTRGY